MRSKPGEIAFAVSAAPELRIYAEEKIGKDLSGKCRSTGGEGVVDIKSSIFMHDSFLLHLHIHTV